MQEIIAIFFINIFIMLKIKELRIKRNMTQSELSEKSGVSKRMISAYESNENDITLSKLQNIASALNVSPSDLIVSDEKTHEPTAVYSLRSDKMEQGQRIPLYDIEASAGLVPLFNDTHQNPVDYITIPNLPKCDGALPITGDSMYPLLKSGDIVMYKQIQDFINDVFFGEMYLISVEVAGEEHVMVKYVQKSDKGDQHIKLVSYNQNHQPKDVLLEKVRAMALIKASIRINSMN